MAGVISKPGGPNNQETYWYATIYLNGSSKQFALFEPNGDRPVNRTRALQLAGEMETRLKQQPSSTATRRSKFTTLWPLFVDDFVVGLADNTQSDYHWAYEGHFKKADFAGKRVHLINHKDIKEYVRSKKAGKTPLSAHTLNNHTGMLSRFFQWAEQNGYWSGPVNPAKGMGIRQKLPGRSIAYLDAPEHALLLVHHFAAPEEEKYRALMATLLWTGIRWSEARSLLWSSVLLDDPKHQHLRITSTAVGNAIQPHPKSKASDRRVGVCPELARILQEWRKATVAGATVASEKTRLGIAGNDGLVFPSDDGTLLSPGNFRRRQFKKAKEAAHLLDPSFPLDLEVHGCRHSYAMMLLSGGLTEYEVGFELGHSKGRLGSTGAYTHADAKKLNPKAAAAVEKAIQEGRLALPGKKLIFDGLAIVPMPAPAPPQPRPAYAKPKRKGIGPAKQMASWSDDPSKP